MHTGIERNASIQKRRKIVFKAKTIASPEEQLNF
jgi:hypothetical protein